MSTNILNVSSTLTASPVCPLLIIHNETGFTATVHHPLIQIPYIKVAQHFISFSRYFSTRSLLLLKNIVLMTLTLIIPSSVILHNTHSFVIKAPRKDSDTPHVPLPRLMWCNSRDIWCLADTPLAIIVSFLMHQCSTMAIIRVYKNTSRFISPNPFNLWTEVGWIMLWKDYL